MKKTAFLLLITAAALATGCSKKTAAPEATQPAASTEAASQAEVAKEVDVPRAAVYDPNMVPGNIVWDSPEKQRAFEERQRKAQQAAR